MLNYLLVNSINHWAHRANSPNCSMLIPVYVYMYTWIWSYDTCTYCLIRVLEMHSSVRWLFTWHVVLIYHLMRLSRGLLPLLPSLLLLRVLKAATVFQRFPRSFCSNELQYAISVLFLLDSYMYMYLILNSMFCVLVFYCVVSSEVFVSICSLSSKIKLFIQAHLIRFEMSIEHWSFKSTSWK